MSIDRAALDTAIDAANDALVDLAPRIHGHPERAFQEHRASGRIDECVEQLTGVTVERGCGGLATAFGAGAGSRAPRLAVLAEYDAPALRRGEQPGQQ